jgi:3-isopropylmalate/(R)-2-methylmalate dehydratase small subunit
MKNKVISGKVFVLGNDVDTDQIIPAQHLVYSTHSPEERKLFGRYALSGVPDNESGLPYGGMRFVEEGEYRSMFRIIVAGKNFGCGSSREHAPLALNVAGVEAVVASSYARIFYRNSVDGGFILPLESREIIYENFSTGDEAEIDTVNNEIRNLSTGKSYLLKPLGDAGDIIQAGGLFAYARKLGIVKSVEVE